MRKRGHLWIRLATIASAFRVLLLVYMMLLLLGDWTRLRKPRHGQDTFSMENWLQPDSQIVECLLLSLLHGVRDLFNLGRMRQLANDLVEN